MRHLLFLLLIGVAQILLPPPAFGAEPKADNNSQAIRFFETKVRPVLATRCYKCHGPKKQESNLRLDSRDAILRGGDSGMAIVPGSPEQSLLLDALSYDNDELQMPPDERLSDQQIADLTHWVKIGAPFPNGAALLPPDREKVDLEVARQFWAFQPPLDPPLPPVKDAGWPSTPIDHFVLAKLEEKGLQPAPRADKRTLIRRATFDLTGLPPTPDEVAAFLADDSPNAFATVIERLLSSPRYGERWGRHWLDVARYADSNGLDENIAHGNAWRYRDYVIAAFNKDKPFDQFVVEQLAGDLLPKTADESKRHEQLIATGFLSLGPKVLAEVDERKMEMDIVDEQIDTFGRAFLALTLGCARCHEHKFDPIDLDDYYGLAGIFKSTHTMESFTKIAKWHENSIATSDEKADKAAHDKEVAAKKAAIKQVTDSANKQLKAASESGKLPANPESKFSDETKTQLKKLRDELAAIEKAAPELSTAMGVIDGEVANVSIHVRGSHLALGKNVARRFPQVLSAEDRPVLDAKKSGRLQLAQWLADPNHPLTARVIVNRIWRGHFGAGLVETPDNFGHLGARPTNQPLLDWLARRFADDGWSIKRLHRLIMLSSTYQMSSSYNERAAAVDPQNRLLWRMNVRRLESESIRDSLLAVSEQIDFGMGGSMLHVKNREFIFNHTSKDETTYDTRRRSVYLPVVRNHLYDVFQLFDYTDASVVKGSRATTTVAPQALFMMNSDLVSTAARAFAETLMSQPSSTDVDRMKQLYRVALARLPNPDETRRGSRFLQRYAESFSDPESDDATRQADAWAALCQVVLSTNEFIYVK